MVVFIGGVGKDMDERGRRRRVVCVEPDTLRQVRQWHRTCFLLEKIQEVIYGRLRIGRELGGRDEMGMQVTCASGASVKVYFTSEQRQDPFPMMF